LLGDILYTPGAADRRALLQEFDQALGTMLAEGIIRPARVEVVGGLDAAPGGYQRLADKKVSACKLVVVLQ
jgi:hypothetical protein